MTNKTANTNNTSSSNTETQVTLPASTEMDILHAAQAAVTAGGKTDIDPKTLTAEQLVELAQGNDKFKKLKVAQARRDWISIVSAGAIAASATTADMLVRNKLNTAINGDDAPQYSAVEIVGVALVTATVATGIRAGLDFIPKVNGNDSVGLVATSLVGNSTFVASAMLRDSLLGMIKGNNTADLGALVEAD